MEDTPINNVTFAYQIGRTPTNVYFGTTKVSPDVLPGVFTGTAANWGKVAERVRTEILDHRAKDSLVKIIAIGRTGTINNGYRLTNIIEATEPTLPRLITDGVAFKTKKETI